MPLRSIGRCTFAAGVMSCAVFGIGSAQAELIVAAGHSVSLMTLSSIDQGCHSDGAVTVNVIEPPRGGYLEVVQVNAYPNFNALNTRSRCNTLKLPATQVLYQSAGNFLGLDSVTVEVVFPDGGARRIHVPVTVRPVAPNFAPAPPPGAETVAAVPGAPLTPIPAVRPKKAVRHRNVAAATSHRRTCKGTCDVPVSKPAEHPAVAKSPLVNI